MNKPALKTFATTARKELLKKVEAKAMKMGITRDAIKKADIESSDAIFFDGKQLSQVEKNQRNHLITRIKEMGFNQVMEEVAYTWFNRLTALRYMEVNNYLPTKIRVLSSTDADRTEPDMMKEALNLDLELDKELVYDMKLNNKTDELFKYLIIEHCNDLNRFLPFMFEKIDHYTQILFPDGLLATDSFIRHMINTEIIPEDNWKQIEVIGWLYQYYIAEEKDRVFKEKKKFKAEEIPFATQLFTPDWIVRYMVQNSLGRYWIESHPEHRDLLENWEYYLENPIPEPDFEAKLAPYMNKELRVEDIKCFDPAMGSGHILVYMFDVLYEIYCKCGYMEREIPRLILENNLYGLDIDDRAYQLASFSVVMKALQYNKRFFRSIEKEGLHLHLTSLQETNHLTDEDIMYIAGEHSGSKFNQTKEFVEQFQDAKTIGSLIKVASFSKEFLETRLEIMKANPVDDLFLMETREKSLTLLPQLIKQAHIMNNQFDILVTNPPYMGLRNMNSVLSDFLMKNYPDSKADLFASFMEVDYYLKQTSFYASINQQSWMFLSSFEKLREKVIQNKSIASMLHLGPRAFEEIGGEVVQSTAFVLRNVKIPNIQGTYLRLIDEKTAKEKKVRTEEAVKNPTVPYRYSFDQDNFSKIPGSPIAYWVSETIGSIFQNPLLYEYSISDGQNVTGNNNKFVRFYWEVQSNDIGKGNKWIFYAKGGGYRKWSGNMDSVVDWSIEAREHYKKNSICRIIPEYLWYKKGITWGLITSNFPSFRILPENSTFDKGGSSIFLKNEKDYNFVLALLNSKVFILISKILNPTLNFQVRDIRSFPVIFPDMQTRQEIDLLVEENIEISKGDWDAFEVSSDFEKHPLLAYDHPSKILSETYDNWVDITKEKFEKMKCNEALLNNKIAGLYGIDQINLEVSDEEITVRIGNQEREMKSFLSYAVGSMFGRYSLDEEGIIYAGGKFDPSRYETFKADKDNILPILPGSYFEDDIVSRFVEFVQVTFGEETLQENLDFIADTLGKKKGETAKETIRRYFLNDFFKDHMQTYKKRPIYWLFTSGKQKAFNCLIYMHRYDKTTLSRIRTDYLHEYQVRLDAEKKDLLNIIEGDSSAKEISNAKKEWKVLDKKIEELKEYDEQLHHMADRQIEIDLDDGVLVNYEKFKGLVAKI